MANVQRNFIAGRMNKSLDERLLPNGEYINALNVRLGSTEQSEVGSVENSKGNTKLTQLVYINGVPLSTSARCIGAFDDSANATLYWFIHDSAFTLGATGRLDLIVSFNVQTGGVNYHVISIDNGIGAQTTLNFNSNFLITGINKIDNLLFFTDNVNPPRVINVERNYPNPVNNIDQFDSREIQVIKQPPLTSPSVRLINANETENYISDKFICFGYRYRYSNAEYSATSQFSQPAFLPSAFSFDPSNVTNSGMSNQFNAAIVTYNTGGFLVKGIDILFKEANDPTIKVIERLDKAKLGINDNNSAATITFDVAKIFSILPEAEILRLYDNVPTLAKAQTLMANRLVYGNYFEGYDLKDAANRPTTLSYIATGSSALINRSTIPTSFAQSTYTAFLTPPANVSPQDSKLIMDFNGSTQDLIIGAEISINFEFIHAQWEGATTPSGTTPSTSIGFRYILTQDFTTGTSANNPLQGLIGSADFKAKFGITQNNPSPSIQTVANAQSGLGTTLTDLINNALEGQLISPQYDLNQTGIETPTAAPPNIGQGIIITQVPGDINQLQMQILSAQYLENGGSNTPVEYYKFTSATVSLQRIANTSSLHSNRGYEIGMIYMDNFNRASTALVSNLNTVNFPCSSSVSKNTINISIPPNQIAPAWATRYKFCIKADKETYQVIYSSIYFEDPDSNNVFFLLEGDNIKKVNEGDVLIVKRDSTGPMRVCTTATVLELKSQIGGENPFISPKNPDDPSVDLPVPSGVYMKMNNISFGATMTSANIVDVKKDPVKCRSNRRFPFMSYPLFDNSVQGVTNGNYTLPIGTRVVFDIEQNRNMGGGGEQRTSILTHVFVCSETYSNWEEFFNAENVEGVIENNCITEVGAPDVNNPIGNIYLNSVTSAAGAQAGKDNANDSEMQAITAFGGDTDSPTKRTDLNDNNYYRLYKDTSTNNYYFMVSGTNAATSPSESTVRVNITVFRRDNSIIFETTPEDALPDLWYEGSQTFLIDSIGQHLGNVVNQNFTQKVAASLSTNFNNCFSFGNGAESYRILDSSIGKQFNLGNRTFTTNNTTFQKAHRFADLTYSGVFNDETNTNKLNEFNLGLANFKPLEETFGDVEILFARRDDILVLQEDKISYVLAGKDLLTDAAGGGQLTSVPTVLGKQIARIENYGISNNPESFAVWGESKYFTDAKRSAVIHLIGSSAANEQLIVISEAGMRSFFRDLFTKSFTSQKLGAYDPYMNEYVLTSNTILKPEVARCTACGVTRDITIPAGEEVIYCVDLEEQEGTVVVRYEIPLEGPQKIITESTSQDIVTELGEDIETEGATGVVGYTITASYNGVETTTGEVFTSGTFTFEKDSTTVNQVVIILSSSATVPDTIEVTVECPSGTLLNLYSICLTDSFDAGKFIHNEASWSDGFLTSSIQSNLVPFGTGTGVFVISQYIDLVGDQGVGLIPTDGSIMTLGVNKIRFDDFVFDTANNSLGFHRSDIIYGNNITDITALLALETTIPINNLDAPDLYTGSFTVPAGGNHLYLIYDYRNPNRVTPGPPSPPVNDFTRYTQCQGPDTIVFKAATGFTFPQVARHEGVCYQKQIAVLVSSSILVPTGTDTFVDCTTCEAAPPPPTPSTAPLLTTNSSTNVTTNSFTANGSLDTANGTVTSRGFYIGTNSSYLSNTQYQVSGTSIGSFTYNFASASAGITYYITAYAINENGLGVGATVSTTTTSVTYNYATYTGCQDSTLTQTFRSETTISFPVVVEVNGVCYGNVTPTPTPTTNILPTTVFDNCDLCVGDTPPPPVPDTPTPTPSSFVSENFTIQLCDGTGPSYIITINNIPTSGAVTLSNFIVNSSVRLNGNYGQPVSTYPEFDGADNYKITAVGTANPLVTLAYVARVDDCSDWPGGDPPPPPPFLYYKLEGCLVATDDCYYLTDQGQPNPNQRFVGNDAGVTFFYTYTGDAGLANNPGDLCAVQPVGSNINCPPTPPPPEPPAPTPPTQKISVRECNNSGGQLYYFTVTNANGFQQGFALTVSGGPDDSKTWEVIDPAYTGNTLYNVTYVSLTTSCPPPPTPPGPTPPTTVFAEYTKCFNASVTANVSGPVGTTFPNVLKISGVCYEYSSLSGTSGQDFNNFTDYSDCTTCLGTAPTPPTPPPVPTPGPPTPGPTPGVCSAINGITRSTVSGNDACAGTRAETSYFDSSSLCLATAYYGTDITCSNFGNAGYISDGSYSRYWSGNSFIGSCAGCP